MRALMLSILAIIFLTFVVYIYTWWRTPDDNIAPLPSSLRLVGVVDMDDDHAVTVKGVKEGNDVLMVLDYSDFVNQFIPAHPELAQYYSKPFDIIYYDTNHSGVIDNQEPIWPYLYVVTYSQDGTTYQVRHLEDAGIHAILPEHLSTQGNHRVLLTDGDTRILYETSDLAKKKYP